MDTPSLHDEKKSPDGAIDESYSQDEGEAVPAGSQELHRKLRGRQVQLFAIGGAIGTCTLIIKTPHLERGVTTDMEAQLSSCKWEQFFPKEGQQGFS